MKYKIIGERREDGYRIKWLYDLDGKQFQALVLIRNWMWKKVKNKDGITQYAKIPRMITRVQLVDKNKYYKNGIKYA